jgi:predicted DNA-binding protein (MmcQ/YjbR family)
MLDFSKEPALTLPPPDPSSLEGLLRSRALSFPETSEDFPWGERAIKVRGKAFLFLRGDGSEVSFSVKLPSSAAEALELPDAEPTHYGLGKHGWVTIRVDSGRDAPLTTFESWLAESYRAVAPKKLGAQLEQR